MLFLEFCTFQRYLIRSRLTVLEHTLKFVRSSCNKAASRLEFMFLKRFVSSAKLTIVELCTELKRCFSYNINNNGPSIDSCGTPDVTFNGLDITPLTIASS